MNFLICLCAFSIFNTAIISEYTGRRYFPEENDPNRIRYLYVERSPGNIEIEDITSTTVQLEATEDHITYFLYTNESSEIPVVINSGEEDKVGSSTFNSSRKTIFVVHGWLDSHDSEFTDVLKKGILTKNVNLFIVDWEEPAGANYISAKNAVVPVGKFIANFINNLIAKNILNLSSVILCGFSLGAHVVGSTGSSLNGLVDHIIGLDPAGPLFSLQDTDSRLDQSDAKFVHVIHTSKTAGFSSSIGHADYFPNGGTSQPGCGLDLLGICAHTRAFFYYAESAWNLAFYSRKCDSIKSFRQGRCNSNEISLMGGIEVDESASGDYYLDTNSAEPFAKGSV